MNRKSGSLFIKKILYYGMRYYSEKNYDNTARLVGYAFDSIMHEINIEGAYEFDEGHKVLEFLQSLPIRFGTCLDVGANIGNHTVNFFAPHFNNVACFEPNPDIFPLLAHNTRMLKNVTIFEYGLSNTTGRFPFTVVGTNLAASSIVEERAAIDVGPEQFIDVKVLDEVWDEATQIDFVKVDIEGHEFQFLEGASQMIKRDRPVIFFEEGAVDENNSSVVVDYLKGLDYEIWEYRENFRFSRGILPSLISCLLRDLFGQHGACKVGC